MNTYTGLQIPTPILRELLDFLHWQHSDLDPSEAAAQALRMWLDDMRRKLLMDKDQEADGYLWKNVFLPNGTRIHFAGTTGIGFAFIVKGEFIYNGVAMSPNKYATLAAGHTRNAWRDLVLRLPGEVRPKLAYIVRREQTGAAPRRRISQQTGSPARRPSDAELLPPPYKPPKGPLADIPDWVMNNRRKNCKCMGDTMFED